MNQTNVRDLVTFMNTVVESNEFSKLALEGYSYDTEDGSICSALNKLGVKHCDGSNQVMHLSVMKTVPCCTAEHDCSLLV